MFIANEDEIEERIVTPLGTFVQNIYHGKGE